MKAFIAIFMLKVNHTRILRKVIFIDILVLLERINTANRYVYT